MPGFKFKLTQLVTVPGKNQQGRISARTEFVNQDSVYQVKWLDDDLEVYTGTFTESELAAAQTDLTEITIDWTKARAAVKKAADVKHETAWTATPARPRCPRKPRPKSSARRSRPKARSRKARG